MVRPSVTVALEANLSTTVSRFTGQLEPHHVAVPEPAATQNSDARVQSAAALQDAPSGAREPQHHALSLRLPREGLGAPREPRAACTAGARLLANRPCETATALVDVRPPT